MKIKIYKSVILSVVLYARKTCTLSLRKEQRVFENRVLRIFGPERDDNIKMNLREIGWGSMDWIDLAQDRDQWSCSLFKKDWAPDIWFKRQQVTVSCRKLHNEECRHFYSEPNAIRIIKSRRIRWRASSTHGREERYVHCLIRKCDGNSHLEDLKVDERVILGRILNRMDGCGLHSSSLRTGTSGGLL
jgi:hypothetical protein